MIRYAKINLENIVENIIVADESYVKNSDESVIEINNLTGDANIGSTYSKEKNKFAFKLFESWVFDEDEYQWKAPVEKPLTGNYIWNESEIEWEEVVSDLPSEE